MKILFLTHYGELYGANLSMCNVAQEINRRGVHTADILSLTNPCEQLESHCKAVGIKLHKVQFYNTCYSLDEKIKGRIKSAIKYCLNKASINKLDFLFIDNNFDLIHSNTMASLVGAMLAKRHRIPHVWHMREFLEEDYNIGQYMGPGYKELLSYTCKFIAISNAIAKKYSDRIPTEKIQLVYNGVPVIGKNTKADDVLSYKKLSLRDNNKMIFAISGVIRKEKGTLEAIEAFNLLLEDERANNASANIELWIIGGGMENKEDPYIQKVSSAGEKNTNKIKFLGYRKDITQLMPQIDVGLVCSWMEAFGRITIEYMQNNIYVIGTESGGTAELIEDNVTGTFYKPGDIHVLEEKMLHCILNPEEVRRVSENAMEYVKEFSIENCVDGILTVYDEIFQQKESE